GGHDVIRNGVAPLAARAIAAASAAAPVIAAPSMKPSSAKLAQGAVQFDNRSRQLELSLIDSNNASLARSVQNPVSKDLAYSSAFLLERSNRSHKIDGTSLDAARISGSLSKDDGSLAGTIDRAFATYLMS